MIRLPLLLITSVFFASATLAQDSTDYVTKASKERRDTRSFGERIWFGGGLGLQFGQVTVLQADPLIGYKVDQEGRLSVGPGFAYWYQRDNRFAPPIEFNAYGYRLFSRYRFIDHAYVHAEYLNLNAQRFNAVTERVQRIWVPHLLVGGGYLQQLGENSTISLQVLFEVLQDPNSVYRGQGPIFGGGFGFGF